MAVATKCARTTRGVTAALVDMASCYSQTGKHAKVNISFLLMSEQNTSDQVLLTIAIFYVTRAWKWILNYRNLLYYKFPLETFFWAEILLKFRRSFHFLPSWTRWPLEMTFYCIHSTRQQLHFPDFIGTVYAKRNEIFNLPWIIKKIVFSSLWR